MRLKVREIADSVVLAGSLEGRLLLAALVSGNAPQKGSGLCFIDFEGVEVATASYLREAILGFRDYCRGRQDLFPVVANAGASVLEELEGLLRGRGDSLVVCSVDSDNNVTSALVLGELEDKQRATLAAVCERGEVDATTLSRLGEPDEHIGVTAWNNRLASLASKGILLERRQGKRKLYRPVVPELIRHGS